MVSTAIMLTRCFSQPSLGPSSQPDNVLAGFTGKYKIFDKTAVYGQLLIDKFNVGDFFSGNNTDNSNGVQLGIRGTDLFKVNRLNYLLEYNTVKPYTYSSPQILTSYTELQPAVGRSAWREFQGIYRHIKLFCRAGLILWGN